MVSAKLPQARLRHILEQIDGIAAATQGLDFEQLNNNFLYERAVERAVQIISEAAKELPSDLRTKYPTVYWRPIIGIGNLLRHEYYRIHSRDMWEIVTVHLPALRPLVEKMLADIDNLLAGMRACRKPGVEDEWMAMAQAIMSMATDAQRPA